MTTDTPKSFCPECQATWDQPWYDVCPACQHRFKERPWWQSPWVILGIAGAPAVAILLLGLLPRDTLRLVWTDGRDDLLIILALVGSAFAAMPAGILFACRLKPSVGARVLLSLVFIPIFYAVSFFLCFFACAGVVNR